MDAQIFGEKVILWIGALPVTVTMATSLATSLVLVAVVLALRVALRRSPDGAPAALALLTVEWLDRLVREVAGRPDAVFAPGEAVHLRISLRAPARIVLLDEPPGGPGTQAWPGLGLPPVLAPKPSTGGPAIQQISFDAPLTTGMHRVRLVVAPADLDLGALTPTALPGVAERLTLVDLRYQVTRP